ncbi:SAF domain-containing protein [Streptomonospora nanhaiensis]|uniref:SAF domain-containing protein n=1 Tax=Streptomonospora nanhaiensis TaxID=1323731 RepID=UPI001C9957F3|nr:SAF domain-containing protein [Streptomonospora nanhaiensis]MBX9388489.1 hypothetical protein [Streptomonospora nanhaiensis]
MAGVAERTSKRSSTPATPERLLSAGPRRWRWLALGAAFMVVGAVAVAAALGQVDQRSGMVAAARDLPAGHVLTAEDLHVVEIAGAENLAAVPAGQVDDLVGQRVLSPLHADTLIAPHALGSPDDYPEPDEAVVGARLADNQAPASLAQGADVAVVITATTQGEPPSVEEALTPGEPGVPQEQQAFPTRVQSVEATEDGAMRVELVLAADDAEAVARAASADALTVVEVDGGAG